MIAFRLFSSSAARATQKVLTNPETLNPDEYLTGREHRSRPIYSDTQMTPRLDPRHIILPVVVVVALAAAVVASIYFWRRGTRGYPLYLLFWGMLIVILYIVWRLLS